MARTCTLATGREENNIILFITALHSQLQSVLKGIAHILTNSYSFPASLLLLYWTINEEPFSVS